MKKLKPIWKNWYLAEAYLLGGGSIVLLAGILMFWFINAYEAVDIFVTAAKIHLSFSSVLLICTTVAEFIYKRACK